MSKRTLISCGLVVLLAGGAVFAAHHESGTPAKTPAALVTTYDSLAEILIAGKKADRKIPVNLSLPEDLVAALRAHVKIEVNAGVAFPRARGAVARDREDAGAKTRQAPSDLFADPAVAEDRDRALPQTAPEARAHAALAKTLNGAGDVPGQHQGRPEDSRLAHLARHAP